MFDATFGIQATSEVTFRKEVLAGKGKSQSVQTLSVVVPATSGIPTFDDTDPQAYYSAANALAGVLVAGHGVTATVTNQVTGGAMTISVANPAS